MMRRVGASESQQSACELLQADARTMQNYYTRPFVKEPHFHTGQKTHDGDVSEARRHAALLWFSARSSQTGTRGKQQRCNINEWLWSGSVYQWPGCSQSRFTFSTDANLPSTAQLRLH